MRQHKHVVCAFGAPAIAMSMLLAIGLGGCDDRQQAELKEKAAAAQDKAAEAGKEKAAEVSAEAQQAWESLKSQYAPQVDALNSKVTSLKEQAVKFKDTQLDGYISQLDAKIGEIKSKIGESFSAEGMQSLKDNLATWMNEAKALYDKAAARLAELTKSATGG